MTRVDRFAMKTLAEQPLIGALGSASISLDKPSLLIVGFGITCRRTSVVLGTEAFPESSILTLDVVTQHAASSPPDSKSEPRVVRPRSSLSATNSTRYH